MINLIIFKTWLHVLLLPHSGAHAGVADIMNVMSTLAVIVS